MLFTSLLLLGAMTFIDTSHFYIESENLVESTEAEREELKEKAESKDWIKRLSGGNDLYPGSSFCHYPPVICFHNQAIYKHGYVHHEQVPLFLKYCCLKVPLG